VATSASTPKAFFGVLGVAVDVLERELVRIGNRHQLDHAVFRVAGHARRFLEIVPAQVISGYAIDHAGDAGRQALAANQLHHVRNAQKTGGGETGVGHGGLLGSSADGSSLAGPAVSWKRQVCSVLVY
jgi:hypothetical protein